jgi:hypothetical protein
MFDLIQRLDLFIVEELEKVTQCIQEYTLIDNFNLVYIFFGLFSLSIFCFYSLPRAIDIFLFFLLAFIIFYHIKIPKIKQRVYKDLESGYKNYLLEQELGYRLISCIIYFCLFFFFTYKEQIPEHIYFYYILCDYLLSCTPINSGMLDKDIVTDTA